MKYLIISAALLFSSDVFSQSFDIRITEEEPITSPRTLIVEMQRNTGDEPTVGDFLLGTEFSLKYAPETGITFGAIDNSAGYGINADATGTIASTGEEFQTFVLGSAMFIPSDWSGWTEIMRVEVENGDPGEIIAIGDTELPSGFPTISINLAGANLFEDLVVGEAVALPVILKSFTAEKHTNSSTMVRWASSSEINASHYEVERSTDQVTWSFVGKVSAVGNSTVEQSYDMVDRDLNLNSREDKKIYYYRLKMVDLDGAYEYSPVDAVSFDAIKVSGMFVYPNPTVQDVFVTLENADNAVLRVADRNGKVVLTQKVVTGQDERVVLSNLPSGVYMLSLIQNDEVQTQQVIKMD